MIGLNRDESGLSLVEVLATLSIMSLVGVIIWSIFFQGFEFSQKSTSKNFMIQETNLLITNIKKIHQKADYYSISIPQPCEITLILNGGTEKHEFAHPKICYEYLITNNASDSIDPTNIDPNKKNIKLRFITSDKQDRNNKVTVDTILYRLKKGGI